MKPRSYRLAAWLLAMAMVLGAILVVYGSEVLGPGGHQPVDDGVIRRH